MILFQSLSTNITPIFSTQAMRHEGLTQQRHHFETAIQKIKTIIAYFAEYFQMKSHTLFRVKTSVIVV